MASPFPLEQPSFHEDIGAIKLAVSSIQDLLRNLHLDTAFLKSQTAGLRKDVTSLCSMSGVAMWTAGRPTAPELALSSSAEDEGHSYSKGEPANDGVFDEEGMEFTGFARDAQGSTALISRTAECIPQASKWQANDEEDPVRSISGEFSQSMWPTAHQDSEDPCSQHGNTFTAGGTTLPEIFPFTMYQGGHCKVSRYSTYGSSRSGAFQVPPETHTLPRRSADEKVHAKTPETFHKKSSPASRSTAWLSPRRYTSEASTASSVHAKTPETSHKQPTPASQSAGWLSPRRYTSEASTASSVHGKTLETSHKKSTPASQSAGGRYTSEASTASLGVPKYQSLSDKSNREDGQAIRAMSMDSLGKRSTASLEVAKCQSLSEKSNREDGQAIRVMSMDSLGKRSTASLEVDRVCSAKLIVRQEDLGKVPEHELVMPTNIGKSIASGVEHTGNIMPVEHTDDIMSLSALALSETPLILDPCYGFYFNGLVRLCGLRPWLQRRTWPSWLYQIFMAMIAVTGAVMPAMLLVADAVEGEVDLATFLFMALGAGNAVGFFSCRSCQSSDRGVLPASSTWRWPPLVLPARKKCLMGMDFVLALAVWGSAVGVYIGTSDRDDSIMPTCRALTFAMTGFLHMAIGLIIVNKCICLMAIVDSFTNTVSAHGDAARAGLDWSIVTASCERVKGSIQTGFVATVVAGLVGVAALMFGLVSGNASLSAAPGLLLLVVSLRTLFYAAAVTECFKFVPKHLNSVLTGGVLDAKRSYAVQYVSHSEAGFVIFGVRVTLSGVFKLLYFGGALAMAIQTHTDQGGSIIH